MITLAIDESGQFENVKCEKKIIGGIIYFGNDVDKENVNIKEFLVNTCNKYSLKYPEDLHIKNALGNKKKLIDDSIKYMRNNGNYSFFYIVKSNAERNDYKNISNFIDENSISNLYEHMISELICNMVFYNNKLLEEKDYNLNIATRVATPMVEEKQVINKYKQLGYHMKLEESKKKYLVYLIDNSGFKSILSSKMMECKMKKDLNLALNVEPINYKTDKDLKSYFLYFSDIACSVISETLYKSKGYFDIESSYSELKELLNNEPFIWVYDDIESLLIKLTQDYVNKELFDVMEDLYDIENCTSDYKSYYIKHWAKPIKDNLSSIINENKMNLYISSLDYIISKKGIEDELKQANIEKGIYIANLMLGIIKDYDGSFDYYRFKINDILLRSYNHKGNVDKCYEIIDRIDSLNVKLSLEEEINYLIRKSEIYDNGFDFNRAVSERKRLKDVAELLKENNKYLAKDLITRHPLRGEVQLGKIYSSLGQTLCFMKDYENGEKYFLDALKEFENDEKNYSITTSYLLHMAIESGNEELYKKHVSDYIKGDGIENQLKYILTDNKDSFKLYVYVKALHRFYKNNSEYNEILKKLYSYDYENNKFITSGHPWELIFKRIAIMNYELGNYIEGSRMIDKSIKAVKNPGITIELINKASLLRGAQFSKDKKEIVKVLKSADEIIKTQSHITTYFREYTEETNLEDKEKKFLKKFTYMYN